jgi:hypothetical protein
VIAVPGHFKVAFTHQNHEDDSFAIPSLGKSIQPGLINRPHALRILCCCSQLGADPVGLVHITGLLLQPLLSALKLLLHLPG